MINSPQVVNQPTKAAVIELHLLPSLEYFCALDGFNEILIERHERFVKQSYRNRYYIKTSGGVQMLTVPLLGKHQSKTITEINIDYSKPWQNNHWRTIMSAYRSSPFYEHYADDLHKIIFSGTTSVYDLAMGMLSFCLTSLGWEKLLRESIVFTDVDPAFVDLRGIIVDRDTAAGRDFYQSVPYYQVFGEQFEPNLSVIDLLFCVGPNAGRILCSSKGNRLNK